MASLVEGSHNNHEFSSLVVNRTRPNTDRQPPSSPHMPIREVIEISDDETVPTTTTVLPSFAPRPQQISSEAGPSTHPRPDLSNSPAARRDSKRQKLDESNAIPTHVSSIANSEIPRLRNPHEESKTNDGDDGPGQAYPDFFSDAFIEEFFLNPEIDADIDMVDMHAPKKKEAIPPYFDDPKLHIRMFRGPGYEHFPVPLDLDPKHKEICDKWDRKARQREERRRILQTRYNEFGPYIDETIEVDDFEDDEDERGADNLRPVETECLLRIMDVLPDLEQKFALSKIRSHYESYDFGGEEIEIVPDIAAIVAEILDMDDYPKEKPVVDQSIIPFETQTGKTITWTSLHRNNTQYKKDAVIVLASQFGHVPTHYISKIVQEKQSIWEAYLHIEDIDSNYFQRKDRPYQRSRQPRLQLEKKYQRTHLPQDQQYYANVVNELQAVKQHAMREFLKRDEEQQKIAAEKANLEQHKAKDLIIECQCCFDDEIPINRAITCTAASGEHSFCFNCIVNLANTQIGLMRHEMLCMDGSGCKERLDAEGVGRAVPIKTLDRLLLNEQQAEITAANIEGLEQCPFCDFKAICEPLEVDTIFSCQNPDCFKVTCRVCHEISHSPKTCEEAKRDRGLNARHKVEEARSAAMMRPCPKCKTAIIKEHGCNKMRCQCGAILCYVCKTDLSGLTDGYAHFDRSNTGGGKCSLYDTPGVDRHVQEANDAELKAIREAKAQDAGIEESTLQIETGRKPAIEIGLTNLANVIPAARNRWGRVEPAARRRRHRHNNRNEAAMPAPYQPPAAPLPPIGYWNPPPAYQPPEWNQNQFAAPHANNAAVEAWMNQIDAPAQAFGGRGNFITQPAQMPLNVAREEVRQLQQNLDRENGAFGDFYAPDEDARRAANGPWNDDDFDLDMELDENARTLDLLIEANRVQGFRADLDRRRSEVRRRNSERDNRNAPLQFPNPAFFNLNRNFPTPVTAAQPQPIALQPPVQDTNQDQQQMVLGAEPPNPFNARPIQNAFNGPQMPLQRANTWRDQFRPPTPIPPNVTPPNQNNAGAGIMNRAHPLRRRTLPLPVPTPNFNAYGNNNAVDLDQWGYLGNRHAVGNDANQADNVTGRHQSHGQANQQNHGFNFF